MLEKPNPYKMEAKNGAEIEILGLVGSKGRKYFKISTGSVGIVIDQCKFIKKRAEIFNELGEREIVITAPADQKRLCNAIDEFSEFQQAKIFTRSGWHEGGFALRNGKIITMKDQTKGYPAFPADSSAHRTRGNKIGWKKNVAAPLTGQSIAMTMIMAGLAAPLLRGAGFDINFGIELCGRPGKGKTTILKLVQSMIGSPSEILNFDATPAGLQDEFPKFSDIPMTVDETNFSELTPNLLHGFIFKMADGSLRKTRYQHDVTSYRFTVITSANDPFYLRLKGVQKDAALERMFPINFPPDRESGIFDFCPDGFASSADFVKHLEAGMEANHGWPMRSYLKHLVRAQAVGENALRDRVRNHVVEFERKVGMFPASTRSSKAFGLMFAAGILAQEAKVLPKAWDCYAAVLTSYRNYLAQVPSQAPLSVCLATIIDRPQTLRITAGKLPSLPTDKAFQEAGAFVKIRQNGSVRLMFTQAIREKYIAHWKDLTGTSDYKAWMENEDGRNSIQRAVRQEKTKDRLYSFLVPSDHPLAERASQNNS